MNRIQKHPILQVPRDAGIPFYFSERKLLARKGEVISSALFAHGINVAIIPETEVPRESSAPTGSAPSAW
jgi:hypothetical protein